MDSWIGSKMHLASGLEERFMRSRVMSDHKSNADFLRIVMGEVAAHQGVQRWAVWGPDDLLQMDAIKSRMPGARFIHVIRDGRDVALSMNSERFIRPFAWDKNKSFLVTDLHWRWKVRAWRVEAKVIGPDYLEVRFESLVDCPHEVLSRASELIACEMDCKQIRQCAVGAVKSTNSTSKSQGRVLAANPVRRWKRLLTRDQIASFECCIGDLLLQELGYDSRLSSNLASDTFRLIKNTYPLFFSAKHWLKQHTRAGHLTAIDRMRAA